MNKDLVCNSLTPLRLLILGAGAVVCEYYITSLRLLGLIPHTTVVDFSASSLAEIKKKCPDIKVRQANFRDFLKSSNLQDSFDAALIALPNSLHEEATLRALDCGLHVICEKPLALTQDPCIRLAEHAEKVGRVLAVGMVRRLLPSVSALCNALRADLIGDLISIDIEHGPHIWPSESGAPFHKENGGILADIGVHYLDLIQEIAGELIPLTYWDDSHGGVEANALFQLKTHNGIPVRLELSRMRKLRSTAIFRGKRGELILEKDVFDSCSWWLYESGLIAKLFPFKPFSGGDWPPTFESCFAQQLFEFAYSVQHRVVPRVTARTAASAIALIEWAYNQRNTRKASVVFKKHSDLPLLECGPALVTGGTGFIGSNLVRRLNELGFDRIIVPVRNYRTCSEVARFPVEMPCVDLLNYENVKEVMKSVHWVFHLAYGRDGPQASRVTVEGTRNVVEAAIECGVESVVVLSSMYVFGCPDTKDKVNETYPYAPIGGEYGQSKAKMERWCLDRARSSNRTRIVVLNPSCVYGPGGKTYTEMPISMANEGTFCWIEEGRGTANYTYVDNLIDAMLLAACCKEAHGERFIINDDVTTWRDFLDPLLGPFSGQLSSYTREQLVALQPSPGLKDIFKAVIRNQDVIEVLKANSLFRFVMQVVERRAPRLINRVRELRHSLSSSTIYSHNTQNVPPIWLADLFGPTSTVFSSEKAQRVLGWKPRVSLSEGQNLTMAWLRYMNFL